MFRISRYSPYVSTVLKLRKGFIRASLSSSQESAEGANSSQDQVSLLSPPLSPPPPPPPPLELCCMSGCQNCVLIQHAEELLNMYHDDTAARTVVDKIPDESMKMFLKMELNLK